MKRPLEPVEGGLYPFDPDEGDDEIPGLLDGGGEERGGGGADGRLLGAGTMNRPSGQAEVVTDSAAIKSIRNLARGPRCGWSQDVR